MVEMDLYDVMTQLDIEIKDLNKYLPGKPSRELVVGTKKLTSIDEGESDPIMSQANETIPCDECAV